MKLVWTWRRRAGVLVVVAVAALSSLALFGRRTTPVVLRVARVRQGDLLAAVTGTGTVQPARTVDIKYDGQDFVDALFVHEGQRVRRGQALARMNTQLLAHTRGQGQQIAERDEATLALAQATLRRTEALHREQLVARADLDSARASYDALLHQRNADGQTLLETDTQIARATLRAPLDGVVTQLYVHEGEMLGSAAAVASPGASAAAKPTNVLMTIAQGGALEVWADINAIDLGRVAGGQPAQIAIDAFRPALFDGRVRQIGLQPTVINNVTTYQVKIEIPVPDPRWRIGLPVAVMLRQTLAHDALLVPLAAITTQDDREVVRTVVRNQCDAGIASTPVRILARNAQAAAVEGVHAGDLVVLTSDTLAGDALTAGASYTCQIRELQPNPTFESTRASSAGAAATATVLTPGPPPKNVLQRMFGI